MKSFINVEDIGDLRQALAEAQEIKNDRLKYQHLGKNKIQSTRQIIELLQEQVRNFVGEAEPSDDITMFCLRTGLNTN